MPHPGGTNRYSGLKGAMGATMSSAPASKPPAPSQINAETSLSHLFLPQGSHDITVRGDANVAYKDEVQDSLGHVQVTNSVITVDVPDTRAVAMANSHAALKSADSQNIRIRFVSPLSENLQNTISAIRYDQSTGEVLCVFADTKGAASRAHAEAARMNLHVPDEVQTRPLTDGQKAFISSPAFVGIVHDFAKQILGDHHETPTQESSGTDLATGGSLRGHPEDKQASDPKTMLADARPADQIKTAPPVKSPFSRLISGPH